MQEKQHSFFLNRLVWPFSITFVLHFSTGVCFLYTSVASKIKQAVFFDKGQRHPKSVFNLGPKVGPGLNKKTISMPFFIPGFHCQMENNKNPEGRRAKRAAPFGRRRSRRLVVFHLAVETRNKKPLGNCFLIKGRPNFWPRIENRLWVVLALIKKQGP